MVNGTVEVGLMVEPQMGGNYDDLMRLAKWSENNGLDVFARSDHYLNTGSSDDATDALVSLGGLARETNRIRLTVLVSPVTIRHPAVLAKSAATLADMSGDRFDLGVGTGWMESEHEAFGFDLPPLGPRFDRFSEALAYLWHVLGRASGGYHGEVYQYDGTRARPVVGERVPIVVGGSGKRRTPSLAGRYADEFNMFAADHETYAERIDVMREAAVTAGRDPDRITLSMAVSPIVGRDAADYRRRLHAAAARSGVDADELSARLVERRTPHGTVEEAGAQFAEFASWGVGRFYIQVFETLPDLDLDAVDLAHQAARLA